MNPKIEKFFEFVYSNQDRLRDSAESDDKLLNKIFLLVSTGAFGLSINFYINRSETIISPVYLQISWACLALSIIFNVICYYLARNSKENLFAEIDKKILDGNIDEDTYNQISGKYKKSPITKLMKLLNSLILEFFIIGLIMLTIFAILQI